MSLTNTYDLSDVIYMYDYRNNATSLVGNHEDLIKLIAKGYRRSEGLNTAINTILDNNTCIWNDLGKLQGMNYETKNYIFYDGYNRVINVNNYEAEAKEYIKKNMGGYIRELSFYDVLFREGRWNRRYKRRNVNTYTFRYDPVPFTHCHKGGRYMAAPRVKSWKKLYLDPEYRPYTRGSLDDIPTWWDDKVRRNERNWKSQRKTQYKSVKQSFKNIDKVFPEEHLV
jgi:hypothetical protein